MWAFVLFLIGVVIVIWATERLLEGLVGVARLIRIPTFAVAAVLSGLEAENVAVGLAAAKGGAPLFGEVERELVACREDLQAFAASVYEAADHGSAGSS